MVLCLTGMVLCLPLRLAMTARRSHSFLATGVVQSADRDSFPGSPAVLSKHKFVQSRC